MLFPHSPEIDILTTRVSCFSPYQHRFIEVKPSHDYVYTFPGKKRFAVCHFIKILHRELRICEVPFHSDLKFIQEEKWGRIFEICYILFKWSDTVDQVNHVQFSVYTFFVIDCLYL